MSRNIVEVYEDRNNLLKRFNESLRPSTSEDSAVKDEDFSIFDGSELGCPVVVDDYLTKKWLEVNYLFSTGFRFNRRPGVGEIGADIRTVAEIDGQKYLTVHLGLLDGAVRALNDFRDVEEVYAEWLDNQERYTEEISGLYKKVESLSKQHSRLEEFEEMFGKVAGYVGWDYVGLPSEDFVSGLEKLSVSLKDMSEDETAQEAARLNQELKKYSLAIPQMSKIREYHKSVPRILGDGLIRITSPAASGGLCMHTHPGYDDSYNALPSWDDLMLVAIQSGAFPMMVHFGGGETQGEHYVMHIPRKFFFDEVKQLVDKEAIRDEAGIIQAKQEVLGKRLDDIMANEILGFKVDGKNGKRIAVLSPVVTAREYDKNKEYFESRDTEGILFGVKDMLLDAGNAYIPYTTKFKDWLAQNIGRIPCKRSLMA